MKARTLLEIFENTWFSSNSVLSYTSWVDGFLIGILLVGIVISLIIYIEMYAAYKESLNLNAVLSMVFAFLSIILYRLYPGTIGLFIVVFVKWTFVRLYLLKLVFENTPRYSIHQRISYYSLGIPVFMIFEYLAGSKGLVFIAFLFIFALSVALQIEGFICWKRFYWFQKASLVALLIFHIGAGIVYPTLLLSGSDIIPPDFLVHFSIVFIIFWAVIGVSYHNYKINEIKEEEVLVSVQEKEAEIIELKDTAQLFPADKITIDMIVELAGQINYIETLNRSLIFHGLSTSGQHRTALKKIMKYVPQFKQISKSIIANTEKIRVIEEDTIFFNEPDIKLQISKIYRSQFKSFKRVLSRPENQLRN